MNTYETINLNDYVQTGEGGTALTYTHKTRPTMAKLFNPGNEAELAEKEFLTARAVFEMGIPTPEPLQLVTDGQRRGVEYELIRNKRSFTRIISQEPERLEEISLAFARMARELHTKKADTSRFTSIKETLRRFYQEKDDRVTEEYKERALNFIDKTPDANTCLHGDLHIGNVITDGQRNLWIDLGQFCYGEPEWDLGWMWTICNRMDGKRTDFILHVTPESLKAHWNIFLAAYLGTDDKTTIGNYTKRIMAYYAVRLPYMVDMQVQGRLPEEALQQLPKVIG
ncbi:MAG: TIGR02172 family protein [Prevotella sp.]|nr:TIGR02172 family protein [Prevotella sp.]